MTPEQRMRGYKDQSSPNRFPRGKGGPGTEVDAASTKGHRVSTGYPDVTAPNTRSTRIGGKVIEGQNLRGYVGASTKAFPTEDGNMRPDGSERTIREVAAPASDDGGAKRNGTMPVTHASRASSRTD